MKKSGEKSLASSTTRVRLGQSRLDNKFFKLEILENRQGFSKKKQLKKEKVGIERKV